MPIAQVRGAYRLSQRSRAARVGEQMNVVWHQAIGPDLDAARLTLSGVDLKQLPEESVIGRGARISPHRCA